MSWYMNQSEEYLYIWFRVDVFIIQYDIFPDIFSGKAAFDIFVLIIYQNMCWYFYAKQIFSNDSRITNIYWNRNRLLHSNPEHFDFVRCLKIYSNPYLFACNTSAKTICYIVHQKVRSISSIRSRNSYTICVSKVCMSD